MPRGRAKNAKLTLIDGNSTGHKTGDLEKRREIENEMSVVEDKKFVAPEEFQGDDRKMFYDIKALLKKMNLLHNADIYLVVNFVRYTVMSNKMHALIAQEGLELIGIKGSIPNPMLKEVRATDMQALKFANELGMTPESRAKLAYNLVKMVSEVSDENF
jgi:P27 family predicted phage terminase small subunit